MTTKDNETLCCDNCGRICKRRDLDVQTGDGGERQELCPSCNSLASETMVLMPLCVRCKDEPVDKEGELCTYCVANCPRCDEPFPKDPAQRALSRHDNATLICPPCGTAEALEDAGCADPYEGPRYWREPMKLANYMVQSNAAEAEMRVLVAMAEELGMQVIDSDTLLGSARQSEELMKRFSERFGDRPGSDFQALYGAKVTTKEDDDV